MFGGTPSGAELEKDVSRFDAGVGDYSDESLRLPHCLLQDGVNLCAYWKFVAIHAGGTNRLWRNGEGGTEQLEQGFGERLIFAGVADKNLNPGRVLGLGRPCAQASG